MKKRTLLKLISGITVFLIIFFLFNIYNGFMGNPLTAKFANSKIKAYVNKTYPNLDLTISETKYTFKDSAYYSKVQSKKSQDTQFTVSCRKGRVTDDYEYEVANKFTTYRRLSETFNKDVEDILSKEFPYHTTIVIGDYGKEELNFNKLKLDMPYDLTNPPLPASLTVYCSSDVFTYEVLSKRLLELDAIMKRHNIPITTYSLTLEAYETEEKPASHRLYLIDFPADKINSTDLVHVLKKHQSDWEQDPAHQK
ncbi:YfjL-like protein [Anaerocolumna sp. MB42-C2]|uniref:YfjL-like protein n=1 Tax=Anaerocolumna sp. MB42-C2 TaxID=3070997 RepID=UPI0027DFC1FF|nr:hypothetical protein [Anaerocolumna sp. MB42-C2]WMJ89891.1 hypothetical protein RBU59_10300 [Anaerocolumna sp. MB42-C2]